MENNSSENSKTLKTLYFGAGCFWGVEEKFRTFPGVVATEVGYGGGHTDKPTYKDVCQGNTGHVEVVKVSYPAEIAKELVMFFFEIHDASQLNRQGVDIGEQYSSVIFWTEPAQQQLGQEVLELAQTSYGDKKIVTKIEEFKNYTPAEEYHQKYVQKNGWSCAY